MSLHSKKISSIRNPQKRFGRFEIASKWLEMLKKRFFSSTEPLKVLLLDTRAEPSPTKLLRFGRPKIGFVGKYETFVVFYEKIYRVAHEE